jgi:hypothetical protein
MKVLPAENRQMVVSLQRTTQKTRKDIDKYITTMKTNSSEDKLLEAAYDLNAQKFYLAQKPI